MGSSLRFKWDKTTALCLLEFKRRVIGLIVAYNGRFWTRHRETWDDFYSCVRASDLVCNLIKVISGELRGRGLNCVG